MPERETPPQLIVISGPSGAGKDTIATVIRQKLPDTEMVVTYADRPPRDDEVEGVDYHFISPEKFNEMIEKGLFAEIAQTGASRKGTKKDDLSKNNGYTVWRIDMSRSATLPDMPKGTKLTEEEAAVIKAKTTVVFIGTTSLFTQKSRALSRDNGSMTRDEYRTRLRDDWKIWQEYKDRFETNGTHESGVRYFVVLNDNPPEGVAIEEHINTVADEIIEKLGL